jgi:NADH-quinone oxidoreductase subunit M
MFFMVGVIYDRVHHRDLNRFGGLFARMPIYSGLAIGIFFPGLGLPGLCGFIGEVLVVLSVWNYSTGLAVVAAAVVILTAGYILWAIQRVYLGAEYKGPHPEALTPITLRELSIAAPLLAFAIWFGVNPNALLKYMQPSVDKTVTDLADWTRTHEPAKLQSQGGPQTAMAEQSELRAPTDLPLVRAERASTGQMTGTEPDDKTADTKSHIAFHPSQEPAQANTMPSFSRWNEANRE